MLPGECCKCLCADPLRRSAGSEVWCPHSATHNVASIKGPGATLQSMMHVTCTCKRRKCWSTDFQGNLMTASAQKHHTGLEHKTVVNVGALTFRAIWWQRTHRSTTSWDLWLLRWMGNWRLRVCVCVYVCVCVCVCMCVCVCVCV